MPVRNPILPGFNPDPSILRVGDDYYIATSTFEWHPACKSTTPRTSPTENSWSARLPVNLAGYARRSR